MVQKFRLKRGATDTGEAAKKKVEKPRAGLAIDAGKYLFASSGAALIPRRSTP
jgi:hypothetical protein